MTVLDFLNLTRRGWKVLVLGVLVGIVLGAAYGLLVPKVYDARATGFVAAKGSSVVTGTDEAVARAGAYVPLIDSRQVRDAIAAEAGADPSSLSGELTARVVPGSTLVEVTARSGDPQSAVALANGALRALAAVVGEIEAAAGNAEGTVIEIIPMDNAVAPAEPSSPNLRLALLAGGLGGLVLGYVVLVLRRALDVKVRAHTDIPDLMATGVLGRVPSFGRREAPEPGSHVEAIANEAYRQIRTGLRFSSIDSEVRVAMVTSASQGEGKSTIAASLARVLAESGQRTLIVDADLRRPKVARTFGLEGAVGLSGVLSGQVAVTAAIRATSDPNLFVLPAGAVPPNPSEMLGSTALRTLLDDLRREFFIVVDAPPVLPVTDATLVSTVVDGVVFVLAAGRTRKAAASAARVQLEQVGARLLGAVLNQVSLKEGGAEGYGYGYYRQNRDYYVTSTTSEAKGEARVREAVPLAPHVPVAAAAPDPVVATPPEQRAAPDAPGAEPGVPVTRRDAPRTTPAAPPLRRSVRS